MVKKIVHALYCSTRAGFEPSAVELVDGEIVEASEWLHKQGLLVGRESLAIGAERKAVMIRPGDVLLMLDSSWARFGEFYPIFLRAREAHVPIYSVVYDLLPILLPAGNFLTGGKEGFEGWLNAAIQNSDGLVCISRATADEVVKYMCRQTDAEPRRLPRVGYWHLGADFASTARLETAGHILEPILTKPYLLMVGTIEPRKSHSLALEAMEHLWDEGSELNLCIVGKEGWLVEELMARLRMHPLSGKKLFLLEKTADGDIASLYASAKGLFLLSKGEGFGLPLVEAAHYGVPIVCSNIPVFKELAGEFATYVEIGEAKLLARELASWWEKCQAGHLPDTKQMPRLTWEESASSLLRVVLDEEWID